MNLIRNRVVIVIALSLLSFTATASVLSGLQHGVEAFSADSTLVISSPNAPTVFSSRIDEGLLSALNSTISQYTGDFRMSPEVFAFCSYQGTAFVVRGVNYSLFNSTGPQFKLFDVEAGESELNRNSAMVGSRLLGRLGLELPLTVSLVGSYSTRMDLVRVVGSFETGTSMDDEMFVSLDRARFLSGTPANKLSIIRVDSEDPVALRNLLTPEEATFTLYDFHISKSVVASGENFTVEVGVRNWGRRAGSVNVDFILRTSTGTESLGQIAVTLDPSSSTKLSTWFRLSVQGEVGIRPSIGDAMPEPLDYQNMTVIAPYIKYWGPDEVMLDAPFNVTVLGYDGSPVPGAVVSFMSSTYETDAAGNVTLVADVLGGQLVNATAPGLTGFSKEVEVFDPSSFPDEFLPSVLGFELTPDSVRESQPVRGIVQLANSGTVGGSFDLAVYVDDQVLVYNVSLAPLENRQFDFTLDDLAAGTHTGHVGTFSDEVVVEAWYASEPDFVELLVRYGGDLQITSSGSIPVYQAAKISQGNVELALFSIGAIAALLAALCITAVFSKEVHEARRRLGVIKTIGASRRDVAMMVSAQALVRGLAGAAVGVCAGLLVADQLSRSGVFMVFGHELSIEWDLQLVLVIFVGAVAISVATALASALIAVRETAISAIRGLPEEVSSMVEGLGSISDDQIG